MVSADVEPSDVVAHDEQDIWLLCRLREGDCQAEEKCAGKDRSAQKFRFHNFVRIPGSSIARPNPVPILPRLPTELRCTTAQCSIVHRPFVSAGEGSGSAETVPPDRHKGCCSLDPGRRNKS